MFILISRTVQGMEKASTRLNNVQELLKNAIFLQQQIKYEQSRRYVYQLNTVGIRVPVFK